MTRRGFLGRLEVYQSKLWLGRIDAPLTPDDLVEVKVQLDELVRRASEEVERARGKARKA
jgi:hypothetical protein